VYQYVKQRSQQDGCRHGNQYAICEAHSLQGPFWYPATAVSAQALQSEA
jgi:hypothetical protein